MIALLIRHGSADSVGRWLAGRRAGVVLNAEGHTHVAVLVRAMTWTPLTAIYTSPLERAVETARPLANDHSLDARVRPALTDIDFGEWTGRALTDLEADPEWVRFNRDRQHASPPGGESLAAVQARIVEELMTLARSHLGETIAVVTHAEPIRCALAAFSGKTLDEAMALNIEPGRVSAIGITPNVRRVLGVNALPMEMSA